MLQKTYQRSKLSILNCILAVPGNFSKSASIFLVLIRLFQISQHKSPGKFCQRSHIACNSLSLLLSSKKPILNRKAMSGTLLKSSHRLNSWQQTFSEIWKSVSKRGYSNNIQVCFLAYPTGISAWLNLQNALNSDIDMYCTRSGRIACVGDTLTTFLDSFCPVWEALCPIGGPLKQWNNQIWQEGKLHMSDKYIV